MAFNALVIKVLIAGAAALLGLAVASTASAIAPEPIPADECAIVSGLVEGEEEPEVVVYNCVPEGVTPAGPYTVVPTGTGSTAGFVPAGVLPQTR